PDGLVREWEYYDGTDRLKREKHPESGEVFYDEYDGAGNLKRKHDANNVETTFRYDGNDRLRVTKVGNKQTIIEYEDGTDNRSGLSVDDVDTSFGYDNGGRLSFRTDVFDTGPVTQWFAYDDNDNIRKITYASEREIEYQYDDENRITL